MATTPTARTLALLRKEGYLPAVVERWLPRGHTRIDLYGCIDIIAIKPGHPVLGIQATSTSNVAARRTKSAAVPALRVWLETGCTFEIIGWSLRGPEGKAKRWGAVRYPLTVADLVTQETKSE